MQDACAREKLCVGGTGLRTLLHFSAAVRNVGDADLLFGASSAAPFVQAACDGQPYFAKYLSYSLLDSDGEVRASGHRQARCAAEGPFASGYDCQFNGVEQGSAQIYPARSLVAQYESAYASGADPESYELPPDEICQWLDVTDVEPGDYLLRIQVNADGLLAEARMDNNRVEFSVKLPALDNPTQVCPADVDSKLLGFAEGRECGWVASAPPASCTPGTIVTVGCSRCTGDPLLRICEGSVPCTWSSAVAWSGGDPPGLCAELAFPCPPSGTYTTFQSHSGRSTAPLTCTLQTTP